MKDSRERLEKNLEEARLRWERLSEKVVALEKQYDLETRADERLRLDDTIATTRRERDAVEGTLRDLEARHQEDRLTRSVADARRMERNHSFAEALKAWEEIQTLDPESAEAQARIDHLTAKTHLEERVKDIQRQLSSRIPEITDLFVPITRRLRELVQSADGSEVESVLPLVKCFLDDEIDADVLRTMWHDLEQKPTAKTSEGPDFSALADRLRRGELVLFLGSEMATLCDPTAPDTQHLAETLARRIQYTEFEGSLSMISELYEMSTEYGKPSLVRNLEPALPADLEIPLYSILAQVETPLVLVSTAYDTLLERAFVRHDKRFAVVSSLISPSDSFEIGSLLIRYSDRDEPELLRLEQGLSELDLLDAGYSLIYKVRGWVDEGIDRDPHRQNALALSENSHFTFAADKDKLIPRYLVKQFAGRGLLLLGCIPKQWEDRLILGAILEQRRHGEQPFTVRREVDRFESAYWAGRQVRRYAIGLREFVETLETHLG